MGLNIKDIRKVVNFCRKNGLIQFKTSDFEFTISERALKLPTSRSNKNPIGNMKQDPLPDLLLWSSTPYGALGDQNA